MALLTEDIWIAWDAALARFCAEDQHLLTLGAHEQAVTHHLGIQVAKVFPGWDTDCEYDRLGKELKRLDNYLERLHAEGLADRDFTPAAVRPDIIVHQRGNPHANCLVIEVKRASNKRDRRFDLIKLECLLDELSYSCGVFVEFGDSGALPITDQVRFERGN